MRVTEIFESIDGEGIRAGYPVTFIRLHGCNLHCSYCDSNYSCDGSGFTEMTIDQITDEVFRLGWQKITLTGGEPLIHPDSYKLIEKLLQYGRQVNVETNGSVDLLPYDSMAFRHELILTADFKCPSSGMSSKMLYNNFRLLREHDVLKFVVGSQEDMQKALTVLNCLNPVCNIFFSPVFDAIEPKDIVEFIMAHHMSKCRVQLQLHKFIWDPMKRGV